MICALILLKKRAFVGEGWLGEKGGMQSLVQKMLHETVSSADNSEVSTALSLVTQHCKNHIQYKLLVSYRIVL